MAVSYLTVQNDRATLNAALRWTRCSICRHSLIFRVSDHIGAAYRITDFATYASNRRSRTAVVLQESGYS